MKKLTRTEVKKLMGGNEPTPGVCKTTCGDGNWIAIYCPLSEKCVYPPNGVWCLITGQQAFCPEA